MAVIGAFAAQTAFAADWTDANGNEYTALKYIKGNGSGSSGGPYIITDFKPVSNSTVKLRFKPTTVLGNECLFCSRKQASNKVSDSMSGFRIGTKIRLDRRHTDRYVTCNTTLLAANNDYSLSADFKGSGTATTGIATINGVDQTLSGVLGNVAYTPASKLTLFASHEDANVSASSTFGNRGSFYLYYFQLYSPDDGSLAHNLMPAQNSSGVAGLYDTVTRTFYGPTGPSGYETFATEAYADRAGKKWTGAGTDNKMSTAANWEGGVAPQADDSLDFTIAVPNAAIEADIDATFGKIYLGAGDLPAFSGTLVATNINDLTRMKAYDTATEGFTFTLKAPVGQDLVWNGGAAANWSTTDASWLCNNAASVWYDYNNAIYNNNAIFNTAGATATLTENAQANSVVFNQNATVDGTATLTVTNVSVAADVAATISAPTAGTLTKTGAGTLTLGSSRTEQTTLTEGTLAMANGATLDITKLTLGTDPAKSVALDLGGAAISANLTARMSATVGGAAGGSVAIDNGEITHAAYLRVWNGSLTLGSDVQVTMNASAERWVCVGGNNSDDESATDKDACLVLDGASINKSGTKAVYLGIGDFGSYPSKGTMIVKNGGSYTTDNSAYVAQGCEGHLVIDGEGSSVTAYQLLFCNETRCAANENGYVVVTNGGTLAVRKLDYGKGAGEGYFRFDGGTLRATAAETLLPAKEKLHYIVGAEGGTIDNDGKNITIAKGFSGSGTLNLTGSGTTTFAAGVGAEGGVSVANGTTLKITATAQSSFDSLALAADSTLNIANYTQGVTPIETSALALPSEGTVNLKLNGGAFSNGAYAICAASSVTVADGGKFTFDTTDNQTAAWSVADGTLLLNVGNYWTGAARDGKMSTAGNWLNGVPAEGDDIDFSGVSSDTTIIADVGHAFGAAKIGSGVITFTNALTVTNFSNTANVAVGADSTVTINGDLVFSWSDESAHPICNNVASGGVFRVTGSIIADSANRGYIVPCPSSIAGTIAAAGLVNNSSINSDNAFRLVRGTTGSSVNWEIGASGLSGTKRFVVSDTSGSHATIKAAANFTVSATIVQYRSLTLDTAGYTITLGLGTNTSVKAGGILPANSAGLTTIAGSGTVVANYDVDHLSTLASSKVGQFTVANGATLALMSGSDLGTGPLTVADGGTLKLAESGTVTLGGALALNAGATLDIASSTPGVNPLSVTGLTLPSAAGSVNLTLDGGAFPKGVYAICSNSGITAAAGAKFAPATGSLASLWKVSGDTLYLIVGYESVNIWTGAAGDGKMSTARNWLLGVPAAGESIDFSDVSSATTIAADTGLAFGAATMGSGVITFTGALTVSSFSDTSKVAVDANATVTVTAGVMQTSSPLVHKNTGAFVVTDEQTAVPTGVAYISEVGNADSFETYKFEALTVSNDVAGVFHVASPSAEGSDNPLTGWKKLYIGTGGVNFYGDTALALGRDPASAGTDAGEVHLYPWHGDYAISGKGAHEDSGEASGDESGDESGEESGADTGDGSDDDTSDETPSLFIYAPTYIHTDDENGAARTVTLDGIAVGGGSLTVDGGGTFQVNSTNACNGAVTVTDTATLALGIGANLGTSAISIGSTAKLAISGLGQSTIDTLTLAAGSKLDIVDGTSGSAPLAITTALTLPAAAGTVALTLDGGAFPQGMYKICTLSGVAAEDGEKFAPSTGELLHSWTVIGDTLYLVVGYESSNTWTGATGDQCLSTPGNWSAGWVPTNGVAVIMTNEVVTLTVGTVFSPEVIVFPEGCAAITIADENGIRDLSAIKNYSSETFTFEVPVTFRDQIDVMQSAYFTIVTKGDPPLHAGGAVRFPGGVTGSSFASGTSRMLDGVYTVPDSGNWQANEANKGLWTIRSGSSLTIANATGETRPTINSSTLYIASGGAFTTGVMKTSERLSYRSYGQYVVTNELEVALTKDIYIAQRYGGNFRFETLKLTDNGSGHNFYVANSTRKYGTKDLYIGAGGIDIAGTPDSTTALVLGYDNNTTKNHDEINIRAWHSDYTISGKVNSTTRDIVVIRPAHFYTADLDGEPRTVTMDAHIDLRSTGAVWVNGTGKFVVGDNGTSSGRITVSDSATLAYTPDVNHGAGGTLVGKAATLEVVTGLTTLGNLELNDGATLLFNFTNRAGVPQVGTANNSAAKVNGKVKVKVASAEGVRPTPGEKVLTTCGGFTGKTVTLTADSPKWAGGITINGDGNLVLKVQPPSTMVIVF